MRVGLLTTSWPHRGDPVAGCFVREMALALRDRGHHVTAVATARRAGDRWDAPLRDDGVRLVLAHDLAGRTFYGPGAPDALGLGGRAPSLRALLGAPFAVTALAYAARALAGCDVVVSHFVLPCGLLAAAFDAPHVAVAHGSDAWLLARAPASVQRAVLGGADLLWCSHEALRDALSVPRGMPVVVRPMGWSGAARTQPHGGALRVLCVSRLVPLKRVGAVVEAVGRARARGVDVVLTVAGDGPEAEPLRRGAGEGVRFVGAVDAGARDALLGASDVFVHAAGAARGGRAEGAPVAVLEAMGAGLAVVACDSGGVAGLVGDAGVVLRDGAPAEEIADALVALAGDAARRASLGEAAAARALPWRWDETARWLEEVAVGLARSSRSRGAGRFGRYLRAR